MPETPALSIEQLIHSFQDHSLPLSDWTHEAHLRTGLWHVYHHSLDEATCLLRSGIIVYNHSQGGQNTHKGGYHETITLLWIAVLHHYVNTFPAGTSLAFIEDQFLQSEWADRNLPFLYFSRERLFSVKARSRWIEPDLQPLNF